MGFNVKFSQSTPTMTIKSTSAATTIGDLANIDTTTAEANESGATLVYDSETKTYKAEKVFEYDGEDVTMKGGNF